MRLITLYLSSFAWGMIILFSFIGWGGILKRLLFPKQTIDWGQKTAWGIAFSVFIGGVLNWTGTISREVILIYLGLGFFYWLIDTYQNRNLWLTAIAQYVNDCRKDRVLLVSTLTILLLILLRYSASVASRNFNIHDDHHAYLAFPHQMLQTGSLSTDPFGARRNYSLGGKSFLDTFILSVLSEINLKMMDLGIGLIASVGVILSFSKEERTSPKLVIFVIFIFLLFDLQSVNITAVALAIALYSSLYKFLNCEKIKNNSFFSNSCIIALIASALCSLKSSLIVPIILLISLSYFFNIIENRFEKKAIYEIVSFMILLVIFLLPWMLSMYESAGTLLYPILGKGYHGSVYGTNISPSGEFSIASLVKIIGNAVFSPDIMGIGLLSVMIFSKSRRKLITRGSPLVLVGSAILGKILLSIATGGSVPYRYSIPFIVPTLILLMVMVFKGIKLESLNQLVRSRSVIITFFLAVFLVVSLGNPLKVVILSFKNSLTGVKGVRIFSEKEAQQYAQMLEVIPAEMPTLARLSKPFLLDFKRHTIFLADYPGQFSPPPGMPFFQGGEALATYLKSQSIRYIAYSYAREAYFPFDTFKIRLRPTTAPWRRAQARLTLDFQANLKQLGETRKRIYDDGDNFVIELNSRTE